jgi:3-oxoacyl-[acyl-carrier-protein] synthase-3
VSSLRGIAVRSCGVAVPDKVLTNDDLAATLDTSDAWITERTGIKERRIGGTTASLAAEAAGEALRRAGLTAEDIDVLVVATTTPDYLAPATASTVQDLLGMRRVGAFDLNAGCSGFMYGLVVSAGLVATGCGRVLLVGVDTLSRITDWTDRTIAVLVGDGAGAVVIEAKDEPSNLLSHNLHSDGSLRHLLYCEHGGYLWMDGQEVFRKAVRVVVESAEQALADARVEADDIALLVPHQANRRIIQAACQRLKIPEDRTAVVIDRYGNTSSASIPLALNDAIQSSRIENGDLLLLCGFGAGMSWASAVLRWGP